MKRNSHTYRLSDQEIGLEKVKKEDKHRYRAMENNFATCGHQQPEERKNLLSMSRAKLLLFHFLFRAKKTACDRNLHIRTYARTNARAHSKSLLKITNRLNIVRVQ